MVGKEECGNPIEVLNEDGAQVLGENRLDEDEFEAVTAVRLSLE